MDGRGGDVLGLLEEVAELDAAGVGAPVGAGAVQTGAVDDGGGEG